MGQAFGAHHTTCSPMENSHLPPHTHHGAKKKKKREDTTWHYVCVCLGVCRKANAASGGHGTIWNRDISYYSDPVELYCQGVGSPLGFRACMEAQGFLCRWAQCSLGTRKKGDNCSEGSSLGWGHICNWDKWKEMGPQ